MNWFYLLSIILTEVLSQYLLKRSVDKNSKLSLTGGLLGYMIVAYIYYLMLKSGEELSLANILWNTGTNIFVVIMSVLLFGEHLNIQTIIGIVVSLIGVALLTLKTG